MTQAHSQQASSHWAATIIRPNERRKRKGKEEDDDDDDGGVGITCLVAEAVAYRSGVNLHSPLLLLLLLLSFNYRKEEEGEEGEMIQLVKGTEQ